MKKIICLGVFLVLAITCFAGKVILSGKIVQKGLRKGELVLLYGDKHYKQPSIPFIADEKGRFSVELDIDYPLFVLLKWNGMERKLLLSPNRPLSIKMDTTKNDLIIFSGKAAPENRIIQNTVLNQVPDFAKGKWDSQNQIFIEDYPYSKLQYEEFDKVIMQPVRLEMEKTNIQLKKTGIPAALQQIIASELGYAYQCYLNEFTQNKLRWTNHPDTDSIRKLVVGWLPMPGSEALQSGFYANMAMDMHIKQRFLELAQQPGNENVQERITNFLGSSFQHLDSLIGKYGESAVLNWLYARKHLPSKVQEKLLVNKILDAVDNDYYSTLIYLTDSLNFHFPHSGYHQLVKQLKKKSFESIELGRNNASIKFHSSDNIQSLGDLVAPYKGKFIYLDIWGIWCGPCRIEMGYVAELKERFKGREDIVFLYLHMDDNEKIPDWKEYVFLKNLEGEHYHMDRKRINVIWDDIEAAGGKKNHLYPSYLILGQKGEIIELKAGRPSDKDTLYRQLEEVLNQRK